MKDSIVTLLTLSFVAAVLAGFFSLVLWVGSLWDSVIDSAYENELTVHSEISAIPTSEIEVQWFEKDRFVWLTRNGQFLKNLPEKAGPNRFRIFVRKRPIHTFTISRTTATQKVKYDFLIRKRGEELEVQARWEPHFYSDDAVRSAPFYQRAHYPLSVLE